MKHKFEDKSTSKLYQAFIKKRLLTQSFNNLDTTLTSELASKMVNSLKKANLCQQNNRERQKKARERLDTREKKQEEERQRLKSKIDYRMRISQINLDRANEDRKKTISSRSKQQKSQRQKIEEKKKRELQRSLVQMHNCQTKTENYFRESRLKRQQENERLQKMAIERQRTQQEQEWPEEEIWQSDQKIKMAVKNPRSHSSMQKQKAAPELGQKNNWKSYNGFYGQDSPKILKRSQQQMVQRRKRKKELEERKECRYLSEFVEKMEEIVHVRKKGAKVGKEPTATLPKMTTKTEGLSTSYKRSSQRYSHVGAQAKKTGFSDLYRQKLKEKRTRREEYHSAILAEGDCILERHREQTKVLRQKKIIRDSLNEYNRCSNLLSDSH